MLKLFEVKNKQQTYEQVKAYKRLTLIDKIKLRKIMKAIEDQMIVYGNDSCVAYCNVSVALENYISTLGYEVRDDGYLSRVYISIPKEPEKEYDENDKKIADKLFKEMMNGKSKMNKVDRTQFILDTISEFQKETDSLIYSFPTTLDDEQKHIISQLQTGTDVGDISDNYHSFRELYKYRKVYNAGLFNMWYKKDMYYVHKSLLHNDGELCFGGGWFIVVAVTPFGQISNHYKLEDWNLFDVEETPKAKFAFDGHTPKDALERLKKTVELNEDF